MNTIVCEKHGPSPYCLICKHLREQSGLSYFAIQPEPSEPAQAWCEACDRVLEQEQGWNDAADKQADWKLFCTTCYDNRLSCNRLINWYEGT